MVYTHWLQLLLALILKHSIHLPINCDLFSRKTFHIFCSMMEQGENLLSSAFEKKWLPNIPSYYSLMGFHVAENEMALSSDEFNTFYVVKV